MDPKKEYYIVPKDELIRLYKEERCLDALLSGGADNWEWFSQAVADYITEEKENLEVGDTISYDMIDDIFEQLALIDLKTEEEAKAIIPTEIVD